MSNFKSGAGNLDFGSGDEEDKKDESAGETKVVNDEETEEPESDSTEQLPSTSPQGEAPDAERPSDQPTSGQPSSQGNVQADTYPYFIRRNNIGDERDTRLEIHVRDKVTEQEPKFRNELARQLGASEVSKTDAREFALLAAFQYPERVAELMQEEGFGALN
jgi:cobalamin biosynthesis protein CobT